MIKSNRTYRSEKTCRFSIRKFKVGVTSAMIAAFYLGGVTVAADDLSSDPVQTVPASVLVVEEVVEETPVSEPVAEMTTTAVSVNGLPSSETPAGTEVADAPVSEITEVIEEIEPLPTAVLGASADEETTDEKAGKSSSTLASGLSAGEVETASEKVGKSTTGYVGSLIEKTIKENPKTPVEETVGKADFVFAIDKTGSMRYYIDNVKDNLSDFTTYLDESGIDYQISVVTFGDVAPDNDQYDSSDDAKLIATVNGKEADAVARIQKYLNDIDVFGGGDDAETPTNALKEIGGYDILEGESDLYYKFEGWRDKYPYRDKKEYQENGKMPANKFVFLLTDADFKEETVDDNARNQYKKQHNLDKDYIPRDFVVASYPKMSEIIQAFQGATIKTSVVSHTDFKESYSQLYQQTGGNFYDITENFSDHLKRIAKWVVESVKYPDRDGDGLPDEWEEYGIDLNGNGDYDIPALSNFGADPNVPDIFIEVDVMEGVKNKLEEKEYRYLYEQFERHGIRLHIDAGPDSMNFALGKKWGEIDVKWIDSTDKVLEASQGGSIEYSKLNLTTSYKDWYDLLQKEFEQSRLPVFRHALIVGEKFEESTSSGLASNLPGSAFIVWADAEHILKDKYNGREVGIDGVLGTFMHELGHTLGLYHGGDEHARYKPNYLSVMNYLYQASGLITYNEKDRYNFSEYVFPILNENNLDETKGIGTKIVDNVGGIKFKLTNEIKNNLFNRIISNKWDKQYEAKDIEILNGTGVVDWNQNSKIEIGISADISPETNGVISASINDWERLVFKGGLVGAFGVSYEDLKQELEDGFGKEEIQELTMEELHELSKVGEFGDIVIQPLTYDLEEGDKHTIFLNVVNLYPQATTFTLTLTSDKWSVPLIYNLEAKGDQGVMTYNTLDITLDIPLTRGEIEIKYLVRQENGEEYEFTHVLDVNESQDKQRETVTGVYNYLAINYDDVNGKEISRVGYREEIVRYADDLSSEISKTYYNLTGKEILASEIPDITKPQVIDGYEFVETTGDGLGAALSGTVTLTHHYKPVALVDKNEKLSLSGSEVSGAGTQFLISSSSQTTSHLSRTERSLPNTGDTAPVLGMVGLAMTTLALIEYRRRRS